MPKHEQTRLTFELVNIFSQMAMRNVMLFKRAQQHLVAAVSERAVQAHGLLCIQILEVSAMSFISRLWLHIPSLSCSHYLLFEAIFDLLPVLNDSQLADPVLFL